MFPIEEESAVVSFTAQLEGKTLESKVKKINFATKTFFC